MTETHHRVIQIELSFPELSVASSIPLLVMLAGWCGGHLSVSLACLCGLNTVDQWQKQTVCQKQKRRTFPYCIQLIIMSLHSHTLSNSIWYVWGIALIGMVVEWSKNSLGIYNNTSCLEEWEDSTTTRGSKRSRVDAPLIEEVDVYGSSWWTLLLLYEVRSNVTALPLKLVTFIFVSVKS